MRWGRVHAALVVMAWIVFLVAEPASAGTVPVGLDAIAGFFTGTTPHFEQIAADWSSKIFYSVVILDLLWSLYECIRTNTLEQLIDTFMYRVVGYALGVYLITNQVAITNAVFDTIGQIGTAFALPRGNASLTPNAIVLLGWDAAGKLGSIIPPNNPALSFLAALPLFIASLILQVAFLVVGLEDLVIQIGVQFCVAVGSVLFGLVGTRWTRPIAGLWPKMIVATLLLTIVIGAVAGLGTQLSDQIGQTVAMRGNDIGGVLQDFATVSAASAVYLLLSLFLTGLAAFMGALTPLSVGGTVINAVTNGFAYVTGYNAGSSSHGGSANPSAAGGGRDPVATIEAATTTAG